MPKEKTEQCHPGEDSLQNLLFAFKHEGMNLQTSVLALKLILEEAAAEAFQSAPSSRYARLACYRWELANQRKMLGLPPTMGAYKKLFNENQNLHP